MLPLLICQGEADDSWEHARLTKEVFATTQLLALVVFNANKELQRIESSRHSVLARTHTSVEAAQLRSAQCQTVREWEGVGGSAGEGGGGGFALVDAAGVFEAGARV